MSKPNSKRPLDFDDYEQLRIIYEYDEGALRLSPQGTHIAYLVRSPEETESGQALHADLFVIDIETEESTPVIRGGMASNPTWTPDGRTLAFYYREGDTTTVWVWQLGHDQPRRVSKEACLPLGPGSGPIWDPDGKKLYISLSRASSPSGEPKPEDVLLETQTETSTVQVFQSPEPAGDISFPGQESPDKIPELAIIDLITEETSRPYKDFLIGSFRLSTDGNWIAIAGPNQWPDKPAWRIVHDLHVVPAAGGTPILVAPQVESWGMMARAAYAWSPTTCVLAYIKDKKAWIYKAETGEERPINSEFQLAPHFLMWSPDARWLLAFKSGGAKLLERSNDLIAIPINDGSEAKLLQQAEGKGRGMLSDVLVLGDSRTGILWNNQSVNSCAILTGDRGTKDAEIWELPFDGREPTLLWSNNKWVSLVRTGDSPGIALCQQDETLPPDIWAGKDFESLRQVTTLNPKLDETARGRGEVISWRDEDGDERFGYLFLPLDYKEGDLVPVIADIYPGVSGSDVGRRWNSASGVLPPQMLCGRGFAVLIPDLPGVVAAMPNPKGLAPSLVAGMNELVRLGIADPDRLGVMGQSGGGGGVNIVITQTTIFKAAVSAAGIANWVSFFGQFRTLPDGSPMMYGAGLPSMAYGGPPWEKALDYMRTSAVFHLGSVTTPLMLIHGTGDTQVGDEQSGEMFAGLHSQGKRAVYLRYPDEGHVPSMFSPANRRDVAARVIAWFEQHLKA